MYIKERSEIKEKEPIWERSRKRKRKITREKRRREIKRERKKIERGTRQFRVWRKERSSQKFLF